MLKYKLFFYLHFVFKPNLVFITNFTTGEIQ
jgi:hypothetical protein